MFPYCSSAEITGFEPVPHGVTSRYCEPFNHTSILPGYGAYRLPGTLLLRSPLSVPKSIPLPWAIQVTLKGEPLGFWTILIA